jgi:cytochrome b
VHNVSVPQRVWDLPTRLFHWLIVVLLAGSWITQRLDRMGWHLWCGYAVFAALLFRLAWGVIGSDTARFSQFLKSPIAGLRHLADLRRRGPGHDVGHNAAGGWMVLVLLVLLCVQVATGLCANDQISTQGPLADAVGSANSDWLSHVHAVNFRLIEAAVALHLLAILVYRLRGRSLVWPMITGTKRLPAATRPPRMASLWRALPVLGGAILVVLAVVWGFGD